MNRYIFSLIILALFAHSYSWGADGENKNVFFVQNKIDLGVVERQVSPRHFDFFVALNNPTEKVAIISDTYASCGCFSIEPLETKIEPGSEVKLKISVDRLAVKSNSDYVIAVKFEDSLVITSTFRMTLIDKARISNREPRSTVANRKVLTGSSVLIARNFIYDENEEQQESMIPLDPLFKGGDENVEFEITSQELGRREIGNKRIIEMLYKVTPVVHGKIEDPSDKALKFTWQDDVVVEFPWRFEPSAGADVVLTNLTETENALELTFSVHTLGSAAMNRIVLNGTPLEIVTSKCVGHFKEWYTYKVVCKAPASKLSLLSPPYTFQFVLVGDGYEEVVENSLPMQQEFIRSFLRKD